MNRKETVYVRDADVTVDDSRNSLISCSLYLRIHSANLSSWLYYSCSCGSCRKPQNVEENSVEVNFAFENLLF